MTMMTPPPLDARPVGDARAAFGYSGGTSANGRFNIW
ncbi:hypothetical protein Patl1_32834 [Pistacia atlantica]|uniref:Uncharacterized protein n=1 Tax=Pistacia atlantica TaxID=434234 RepID=A0ACC1AMR6_9ROSI|nr:hypothetical protein Patl1_32834 [Pistacia atlantica]